MYFIQMNQLGQRPHECLIALHPASRIDQDHIVLFILGLQQSFFRNNRRVVLVSFLIEWQIETGGVSL
jgi:hypothetical protein